MIKIGFYEAFSLCFKYYICNNILVDRQVERNLNIRYDKYLSIIKKYNIKYSKELNNYYKYNNGILRTISSKAKIKEFLHNKNFKNKINSLLEETS